MIAIRVNNSKIRVTSFFQLTLPSMKIGNPVLSKIVHLDKVCNVMESKFAITKIQQLGTMNFDYDLKFLVSQPFL